MERSSCFPETRAISRRRFLSAGFLLCAQITTPLMGCDANDAAPPDLRQAAGVVAYTLRATNLSRSMFSAAHPNGKPSEWVSYWFSDMGVAEWPDSEANAE